MNIKISKKYRASLTPFPKETFEFLTGVGLPLHMGYEITPNAPITFFEMPYVKNTIICKTLI